MILTFSMRKNLFFKKNDLFPLKDITIHLHIQLLEVKQPRYRDCHFSTNYSRKNAIVHKRPA